MTDAVDLTDRHTESALQGPRSHGLVLLAIGALGGATFMYQMAFAARHQRGVLNSDALYTYDWLRDLLWRDSGFFWMGPPNPFFFPDALLYLPMLLVSDDVGLQFFSYSVAYGILLAAALAWVLHSVGRDWWTSLLHAALSIGVLALLPEVLPVYRQQVPTANCHGGALLAGLGYIALSVRLLFGADLRYRAHALVVFYIGLASASNLIFPTQFVLPVLFVAMALALVGQIDRARLVPFVIDNMLAAALAAAVRTGVQSIGVFWFARAPLELSGERMLEALRVLRDEWLPLIGRELGGAGISMLIIWCVLTIVLARVAPTADGDQRARHRRLLFVIVAANAVMVASVLAPVLTAMWASGVSVRYAWPFPLLGFLLLVPLALALPAARGWTSNRRVAVAGVVVAMGVGAQSLPQLSVTALRFPDEAVGRRLVELKQAGQISNGLGEFWSARYLTVMTGNRVLVNPVTRDLAPEPWLTNSWDFFGQDPANPPRYNFVVANRLDAAAVDATFGTPTRVEKIGDYEIRFFSETRSADMPERVCRRMLEVGGLCPLLAHGIELVGLMTAGETGKRGSDGLRSSADRAGTFAFGPYVQLPAGRYEVRWRFAEHSLATPQRFLVFSEWGKHVVADQRVVPSTGSGEVRVEFEVRWQDRHSLWEFPVVHEVAQQATLKSVQLRRLTIP